MRIIAGTARGRVLFAPAGAHTRPKADRVREALFSIIARDIKNAVVLDAFAGSGALSLEALSRGADAAVLIDSDLSAIDAINRNVSALNFGDRAQVMHMPLDRALGAMQGIAFNIAFLDPPYALPNAYLSALTALTARNLCARGMIAVLEHPAGEIPLIPAEFAVISTRKYGSVGLTILEYVVIE